MITLAEAVADHANLLARLEADALADAQAELGAVVAYARAQRMLADAEPVVAEAERKLAEKRERCAAMQRALDEADLKVRQKRAELALLPDVPALLDDARAKRAVEFVHNELVHARNERKAELDTAKNIVRKAERELEAVTKTVAALRNVRKPALAVLPVVVPGLA
jgi:hypothetical protein